MNVQHFYFIIMWTHGREWNIFTQNFFWRPNCPPNNLAFQLNLFLFSKKQKKPDGVLLWAVQSASSLLLLLLLLLCLSHWVASFLNVTKELIFLGFTCFYLIRNNQTEMASPKTLGTFPFSSASIDKCSISPIK